MKILVSDFDLTLFDNNYVDNVKVIKKFVEDGNIFIIATGRSLFDLKRDIDHYNLPCSYYICKDASAIYDKDENLIFRRDIDKSLAKEIISYLEKTNNFTDILVDNSYEHTNNIDNVNAIIAKPIDFVLADKILDELKKEYKNIDGYISRHWININNIKCNKAFGIDYLVKLNNYDINNIYTVGDTVNDYQMIKKYNGYAMKCADDYIKDVAISVVSNFDELIQKIKVN